MLTVPLCVHILAPPHCCNDCQNVGSDVEGVVASVWMSPRIDSDHKTSRSEASVVFQFNVHSTCETRPAVDPGAMGAASANPER